MSAADNHSAEMRASLLHRRANRLQEKDMLLKAPARIKEIDAELELINADLTRYGYVDPKPI
jgi:hypothetical protein